MWHVTLSEKYQTAQPFVHEQSFECLETRQQDGLPENIAKKKQKKNPHTTPNKCAFQENSCGAPMQRGRGDSYLFRR